MARNVRKYMQSLSANSYEIQHVIDFDIYDFEMLFNDLPTKELIRTGKTIGCFYIESPGMRSLLRRLDVADF
ncbi:MAG: hypothetical protein MZV64_22140 [Ignavibacteriales bacterium]|nr:hypothetical protein [Ignavibacteriales bacterium]